MTTDRTPTLREDAIPNSVAEVCGAPNPYSTSNCGQLRGHEGDHRPADAAPYRVTKEQNDRIVKRLEDMEFTETEIDMICRVFTEEWLDV